MTNSVDPHVLIVDDARDIREPLAQFLRRQKLRVSLAADAQEARKTLSASAINLVVLDIMLPGESGLSLCRTLVVQGGPPVIMLSARVTDEDRITALDLGADDYMTKPFNPRELLSRIHAVLRRVPARRPESALRLRRFSGIVHDAAACTIHVDGVTVPLTSSENRLMGVFLDFPGETLSRERLLDIIHGRESRAYDRAIDNLISRLRKKIGDDNRTAKLIATEWGGGYRLIATVEDLGLCA